MALISMIPSQTSGEGGGNPHASWFGTGEDGDLIVSTDVALPVALDSGQIIKQYNNLTVTSSGILHPANRCNGMILLVKGDLTVNGTIHADKCAPLLNSNEDIASKEQHVVLCGVSAGGNGGTGGAGFELCGAPGVGGSGFQFGGGFGGGSSGAVSGYYSSSSARVYNAGSGDPRPPIGTATPFVAPTGANAAYGAGSYCSMGRVSARGGAGPGGAGGACYDTGAGDTQEYAYNGAAGDAYPGGAIWIFVRGVVRIGSTASIRANGGDGANGTRGSRGGKSGGGGGGGGGIVCLVHTGDYVNQGSIVANGGSGGTGQSYMDGASQPGTDGSAGVVQISNIADLIAS